MIILTATPTQEGFEFTVARPGRDAVSTTREKEVIGVLLRLGVGYPALLVAHAKEWRVIEIAVDRAC